jgi:predicted Zn-dependent protease
MNKLKQTLLISLIFMFSCAEAPSGRRQLKLVGSDKMDQMGDASFDQLKQKSKLSKDKAKINKVTCISHRVLQAMGEKPSEWSIEVFEDESPNAFALPGKNIGVHTGMMSLVENDDQLAAVIGHEVAHVLSNHGNERMSQGLITQAGMTIAQVTLGENTAQNQLILGALGLGAQLGVLLPYSRKHETEADVLGLKYMSLAGFAPEQAAKLWVKMSQNSGGKAPPEFMSTHPSNQTRITKLSSLAPEYRVKFYKDSAQSCR